MKKNISYPVPTSLSTDASINQGKYEAMYQESLEHPERFWGQQGKKFLSWINPWRETNEHEFNKGKTGWFLGGKLNVCFNCVDRHLRDRGNDTAIIWEGDEPEDSRNITYNELHKEICKLGNALKTHGIKKGDRVCIYMPMIPEAAFAMLACARIGAIHSVVFGGFSPSALRNRILDADCCAVITANEGRRGGKTVPLKKNVDQALTDCPSIEKVFVVKRTEAPTAWEDSRDIWYHEAVERESAECPIEPMDSEDPLFILYTSGSTGKPKGVLHSTAGYLLHVAMSHKYVFDYKDGEIFWCTADVGWITGHSYIIYGPLSNGGKTLIFEGVPTYPDGSRFWNVIDKHEVNIFYTAPTAIRSLMGLGDDFVTKTSRGSLRVLGSVGEPINPEAWEWYYKVVGETKCPIVDTWWQTETGGIMIAPLPGATPLKPGSAAKPFFGIEPVILDGEGNEILGEGSGNLAIKNSWPGQLRTVWGDHKRLVETYFSTYKGYYFTGDGARRDDEGYFWITGRVDDVLNISGHRLGTAEIESALVEHELVAEAAVVGFPHSVKGQGIYAYVTLMKGSTGEQTLIEELKTLVREKIGPIAKPDLIQWAPNLPKTRSGKIMRRILRKIAEGEIQELGDTSTLSDPAAVDELISNRVKQVD
ncbi:MAG: acetate--CoA ligase [Pseudomonadota bacterium]|nr:acetate--CoA ligase [Pseudomonadota bacterium]